jgi:hypothetical protein
MRLLLLAAFCALAACKDNSAGVSGSTGTAQKPPPTTLQDLQSHSSTPPVSATTGDPGIPGAADATSTKTCFGATDSSSPCYECNEDVLTQTGGYAACTLVSIKTIENDKCEYTFKIDGANAEVFGTGNVPVYCSCVCRAQFPNYKG